MGNLIKPADYAAQRGISRQAVYAKIKKGILTSRNIGGKIFVVLDDKAEVNESATTTTSQRQNHHHKTDNQGQEKLLAAKDETITILRETITDLKETNKMITSTLRGEVDLLKEAFSEMKMLYGLQLEHKMEPMDEQTIEADTVEAEPAREPEEEITEEPETQAEWIELSDFYALHDIKKAKKQKKIEKHLKKRLKKGDPRVDHSNGEILFLVGADIEDILAKV
jgi:flagellar biosynthesis GTPase FlhF